MNKITEITKRDIYELFLYGIDSDLPFGTEKIKYPYNGRLTEIEFLEHLYPLEEMPSSDPRFNNAKEDIKYHTIVNDDYPECWIFKDERFPLMNGNDKEFLDFLCKVFHPLTRIEGSYWKKFLDQTNAYLRNDGYEIYTHENISNKPLYTWRLYNKSDYIFIPFSERYKNEIKQGQTKIHIPLIIRKQIYKTLASFDFSYINRDEYGWESTRWFAEDAFDKLRAFYDIKCFNKDRQYVETECLEDFINSNYPEKVLDIIEAFYYKPGEDYIREINMILNQFNIPYILNNEGKLEHKLNIRLNSETQENIKEAGIQELLQIAQSFYDKGDKVIAVEKIWDALERLKTYYSPGLDKKKSIEKIINSMSHNNNIFYNIFDLEFKELTKLGNKLNIRHHEKDKERITDSNYYTYLYQRCLSLIMLSSKYLKEEIS